MYTSLLRFVLGLLLLTALLWLTVQAQGPSSGQVLILENERILTGAVERQGDQYRIRRDAGELWLPVAKVVKVCAGMEEAFAFMCSRANLRDPDERLRLARWCQLNGMFEQAVVQAGVAVEMRPGHREAQQLLATLKRAAVSARNPPAAVVQTSAAAEAPPSVDLSLESLGVFTNKVQPILMNTCATCHAGGRGGDFKLLRAYEGGSVNRRATQYNLAAVLAQVNMERPTLSPLLVKSVSVHGNCTQPPLKGRQSPPYQMLQEWVEVALANNPHLREEHWTPTGVAPVSAVGSFGSAKQPRTQPAPLAAPALLPPLVQMEPPVVSVPSSGETAQPPSRAPSSPSSPEQPAASGGPSDDFDPAIFNQQLHSQK